MSFYVFFLSGFIVVFPQPARSEVASTTPPPPASSVQPNWPGVIEHITDPTPVPQAEDDSSSSDDDDNNDNRGN